MVPTGPGNREKSRNSILAPLGQDLDFQNICDNPGIWEAAQDKLCKYMGSKS